MNYKEQIKEIEDVFFNVNSTRYADIELFSDIFKILDIPDFKKNQPDIHKYELMRIRDLQNSIDTAIEEGETKGIIKGRIEGRAEGIIEVAKNLLKNGIDIEVIKNVTGLTVEEIEKLQ